MAASGRKVAFSNALLQEAGEPLADVGAKVHADSGPWRTGPSRGWRAAVVKLSNRVSVEWLDVKSLPDAQAGKLKDRTGTHAAATITPSSGEPVIAVSVYALWEKPRTLTKGDFIYADASV